MNLPPADLMTLADLIPSMLGVQPAHDNRKRELQTRKIQRYLQALETISHQPLRFKVSRRWMVSKQALKQAMPQLFPQAQPKDQYQHLVTRINQLAQELHILKTQLNALALRQPSSTTLSPH